MSTSIISSLKIRHLIIHSTVFVAIALFFFLHFPLGTMYDKLDWLRLGIAIAAIAAFYIHTFIVLPILIVKKRRKKYVLCVIFGLLLFCAAFAWLNAHYSSSAILINNMRLNPLYFFLTFKTWAQSLLQVLLYFVPFGTLSFSYYFISNGRFYRKSLLSYKYTEFLINLIILSIIYFFAFTILKDLIDLITICTVLLLATLYFYVCTLWYMPRLFLETTKNTFSGITVITSIVYIVLHFLIFPNAITQFSEALSTFLIITFILLFLSFLYSFIRLKQKKQVQFFALQLNSKNSELQLLKSQVNPHFLFNTLNTLYGTALEEEAPKTGESISKLANLLRYMQDDMSKTFIPLENEVAYLKDYIAIQELRCQVSPNVKTVFENLNGKTISPGILIPFVENAFKYGIDPSKVSQLSISVIGDQNMIRFTCTNSYNDDFKAYYKEQGFGLGLKNTKKRLDLIYPKQHSLAITKENQTFTVKLKITL